ncbi:hypothetical protein [Listeria monocytogenes]|uniref:hypothetical protein n=1 Tax=Listeria monocytogenes TaxID=1639 RepID=UPI001751BBB3|nr:hypothetical protein [Listeria monocytogenes]MCD1790734.1 hypothetical protein [Listeria monocytogenes]MCD1799552.1 hypothetical protein [Listeria monocytogenes]MCD1866017.1 hypothetical protein [Listeria monocytogenes]MCM8875939.1 hypothetical protein [Listeria monocytogenes]MCM8916518.1 hypothetical protein [Listeria monocytogenes]
MDIDFYGKHDLWITCFYIYIFDQCGVNKMQPTEVENPLVVDDYWNDGFRH